MLLRNTGHLVLVLSVAAIPAGAQEREPDLKTVLGRAADYASEYHAQLSSMVAEEWYVQRTGSELPTPPSLIPRPRVEKRQRTLKSDFAIVHDTAAGGLWFGVREVFEIDGEPVTGERGRLLRVLSDDSLSVAARVRALADQQAKHNLGDLYRTINVPTLIVTGDEDTLTGTQEAETMRRNISGSQMKVIAKAGHYSAWEQPQEAGRILRQFLDSVVS